MHQVEFDIDFVNIAYPTFGRLRVSDRLILEVLAAPDDEVSKGARGLITMAYIGVEDEGFPRNAYAIFDLFILTLALTGDIIATYRNPVGTEIPSLNELGGVKITLSNYRMHKISAPPDYKKPFLSTRELYSHLEADRQRILSGYLGFGPTLLLLFSTIIS